MAVISLSRSKIIAHARAEAKALLAAVHSLQRAQAATAAGPLSRQILAQSLVVTQAELKAMNRLINSLIVTKLTPTQTYLKVYRLEVAFAETNARLQVFQLSEIVARHVSRFSFAPGFVQNASS